MMLYGWRMIPLSALRQSRQQSANGDIAYHVVLLHFVFFFKHEYIFLLASSPVSGRVVQDSGRILLIVFQYGSSKVSVVSPVWPLPYSAACSKLLQRELAKQQQQQIAGVNVERTAWASNSNVYHSTRYFSALSGLRITWYLVHHTKY